MTQTDVRPTQTTTAPETSTTARTLAVVAFVFAGVAVFFIPIVFGAAGIICGSISMTKGDRLGKWSLLASVAGLVIGIVLSYVALHSQGRA